MPSLIELQMDMEWTPATAAACVEKLCTYLKGEHISTWYHFSPQISEGLTCIADNPDEIYRLALHIKNATGVKEKMLLGRILARVDAELPEHIATQAITQGAMLPLLCNKNYTVKQRLAWIREYADYIIPQGGIGRHDDLETPLKNALMLWFFMEANKGTVPDFVWKQAGWAESAVAKMSFLEETAPDIVERVHMAQAVGLPYKGAFDMLVDEGCAAGLPDLDAADAPG